MLTFSRTISHGSFAAFAFIASFCLSAAACAKDPDGWRLVWSDDFNELDTARWTLVESHEPTNKSQQAYLPSQVSVADGRLILTSDNEPSGKLPFRSGQVISKSSRRFGRWEVRAKLPTTQGMWPAIWLLPDVEEYRWPSGGEIDIMENRGNESNLTSSAFHYGSNPPFRHKFVFAEQQTRYANDLVDYSQQFHTYAVDWSETSLRFYVDGVNHYTVYDEDVESFLSKRTAPMQLVINTAVGGEFLPNPDQSTAWPQQFEVDWVRVYESMPASAESSLINGDFDEGTLAGWSTFGNDLRDNPNVLVIPKRGWQGSAALKLFGTFGTGSQHSGVAQGIRLSGDGPVHATLRTYIASDDGVASTENAVRMKIEFYSEVGAKFGSPAMLGVEQQTIADATSATDTWSQHTMTVEVPAAAKEARLAIVFEQPAKQPGAIWADDVQFGTTDSSKHKN